MKKTPKRQGPKTNNLLAGPTLTHMRDVAYNEYRIKAMNVMRHADRLRDDQGMLDAAEAKRQRKAARALALQNRQTT